MNRIHYDQSMTRRLLIRCMALVLACCLASGSVSAAPSAAFVSQTSKQNLGAALDGQALAITGVSGSQRGFSRHAAVALIAFYAVFAMRAMPRTLRVLNNTPAKVLGTVHSPNHEKSILLLAMLGGAILFGAVLKRLDSNGDVPSGDDLLTKIGEHVASGFPLSKRVWNIINPLRRNPGRVSRLSAKDRILLNRVLDGDAQDKVLAEFLGVKNPQSIKNRFSEIRDKVGRLRFEAVTVQDLRHAASVSTLKKSSRWLEISSMVLEANDKRLAALELSEKRLLFEFLRRDVPDQVLAEVLRLDETTIRQTFSSIRSKLDRIKPNLSADDIEAAHELINVARRHFKDATSYSKRWNILVYRLLANDVRVVASLTPMERNISRIILDFDLNNAEIAKALGIAKGTVNRHMGGIFDQLGRPTAEMIPVTALMKRARERVMNPVKPVTPAQQRAFVLSDYLLKIVEQEIVENLSAQARNVLDLILDNRSNGEIAKLLRLHPNTVKHEVAILLKKLQFYHAPHVSLAELYRAA